MQGHDEHTRTAIDHRLARIEGQIRGVRRLIETGADCEKIAQQLSASRRALDKAFHEMIACMIEKDVMAGGATAGAEKNMSQIRDLLSKYA